MYAGADSNPYLITFIDSLQILSCIHNPTDQAEQLPVHLQKVSFGVCNVPPDHNYKKNNAGVSVIFPLLLRISADICLAIWPSAS